MGFFSFFGDNSKAFDKYSNDMRDAAGRYQGYVDTGNQARGIAYDQYGRLINDPNSLQDQIAGGYNQSPYQKMLLDQVMKRMNYNSANTGMLGSGAANRALMGELNTMTGQFQNDYITRGMQTYGMGLQGMGNLTQLGFNALGAQDPFYEQAAAGNLQGELSKNAARNKFFGGIAGIGTAALTGNLFNPSAWGGLGSMGSNPNSSTFDLGRR